MRTNLLGTLFGCRAAISTMLGQAKPRAGGHVFNMDGAGASGMSQLLRARGRAVIVAIFAEAPKVDLLQFFLNELQLCGVRLYEHEDFELATKLAHQGALPLDTLITERRGLDGLESVFEDMKSGGDLMKVLIDTHS